MRFYLVVHVLHFQGIYVAFWMYNYKHLGVSRGSAGEYQADEQAGDARLSWRISGMPSIGCVDLFQHRDT